MFDEYCIKKILSGEKTVTRRLRKSNRRPAIPGHVHKLKKDRTKKFYGYIYIKDLKKETHPIITEKEAKLEGFNSADEYIKYFYKTNKITHHNVVPTWRIEFELIMEVNNEIY